MNFGRFLIRYFGTWFALALSAVLSATAYNAHAQEFTKLQAVSACINEAEIAAGIQVGRVIEGDSLETFLGRMNQWPTDYEVQHDDYGESAPVAQGLIDYIEAVGVYVFNTYATEATERQVAMESYEHCRVAWMDHFDNGAPAPVFYQMPIGFSEPVYSYTGGG